MPNPKPAARGLIHLAKYHHHVWQYSGLFHVAVEFLSFTTAFADATKDTDASMMPDHVVDHFGEQHSLANACPAKQSRLAASLKWYEHINDFDTRFKDLGLSGTL